MQADFWFLTKDTQLVIRDRFPEVFFPGIQAADPGALAAQWIPAAPELWKLKNNCGFLEARNILLADEANRRMEELLHRDDRWLTWPAPMVVTADALESITGGITSEAEEEQLEELNDWVEGQLLPRGILAHDCSDPDTGEQIAVLDLAWLNGIQEELSQPVAVLLNEDTRTIAVASSAGFRCFIDVTEFKRYISLEILADQEFSDITTAA